MLEKIQRCRLFNEESLAILDALPLTWKLIRAVMSFGHQLVDKSRIELIILRFIRLRADLIRLFTAFWFFSFFDCILGLYDPLVVLVMVNVVVDILDFDHD